MVTTFYSIHDVYLMHHGIKGQKWGVRRYQNSDGTLTPAGVKRYQKAAKTLGKINKPSSIPTLVGGAAFGASTAIVKAMGVASNPATAIIAAATITGAALAKAASVVARKVRNNRAQKFIDQVVDEYGKQNPDTLTERFKEVTKKYPSVYDVDNFKMTTEQFKQKNPMQYQYNTAPWEIKDKTIRDIWERAEGDKDFVDTKKYASKLANVKTTDEYEALVNDIVIEETKKLKKTEERLRREGKLDPETEDKLYYLSSPDDITADIWYDPEFERKWRSLVNP